LRNNFCRNTGRANPLAGSPPEKSRCADRHHQFARHLIKRIGHHQHAQHVQRQESSQNQPRAIWRASVKAVHSGDCVATRSERLILGRLLSLNVLGVLMVGLLRFIMIARELVMTISGSVIFPAASRRADLPRPVLRQKFLRNRLPILLGWESAWV